MKREAKLLAEAMTNWCGKKVKVSVVESLPSTLLLCTPFRTAEGIAIEFYAYLRTGSKHLILSDAGRMIGRASTLGVRLPLDIIQLVAHTYDLFLAEDFSIVDSTKRPLGERVGSMVQACIAVDGIVRTWRATNEVLMKKPKEVPNVTSEEVTT